MPTRVKSPIAIIFALLFVTACNRPAPPIEDFGPGPTPTVESILVPTWQSTNPGIPERAPATSTSIPLVDLVQPAGAVIVSAPALLPANAPTPTFTPWPTVTLPPTEGPCDCSGDLYNCSDFPTPADAQACFAFCPGDVHGLDADNDGFACEYRP